MGNDPSWQGSGRAFAWLLIWLDLGIFIPTALFSPFLGVRWTAILVVLGVGIARLGNALRIRAERQ